MSLKPEVWGIIGIIISTVMGWVGKGLYGRRRADAEIKDFLQSQTDKLYVRLNELMADQLANKEQLMLVHEELHATQRELSKYKTDLVKTQKNLEKANSTIIRLQGRIRELEKK